MFLFMNIFTYQQISFLIKENQFYFELCEDDFVFGIKTTVFRSMKL